MGTNTLNFLKKTAVWVILLIGCFIVQPQAALAHRPHDVIETLAISPTYNQDKTVYIVVRGMAMKSTDGGKNWRRMTAGLDNNGDPVELVIDRQKGSILYMSTPLDGVYKSEDSGNSWFKVNNGINKLNIQHLVMAPDSAEVVLAAANEQELYYTDNGGKNWQSVLKVPGAITALGFAQSNPSQAIAGDNQGNLYFSTNKGKEWQALPSQISGAETITALALAPDNNWFIGTDKRGLFTTSNAGVTIDPVTQGITDKNIRDILISPNYSSDKKIIISTWNDGIFISNDQGKSWQKSDAGLTKDNQADEPEFSLPHFSFLQASKSFAEDKTLYLAGFNGLFHSEDGGQNWREIYTLSIRAVTALGLSPNYAQDQSLALGTYEGEAYLSENGGKSWKSITNGLSVVTRSKEAGGILVEDPRFFDLEFSPAYKSDNTIFASLIYQFTKSVNKGRFWKRVDLTNDPYWRDIYIAPSPNIAKDKTMYLGAKYGGQIYRSTDGANRFTKVGSIGQNLAALKISPNFPEDKTLYAATWTGAYKSVDGGVNWSIITDKTKLQDKPIAWRTIVVSPNYKADKTVFAGTNYGVFQSQDAGQTWKQLANSPQQEYLVDGLAVSPNYAQDKTIMASARGVGLVKITDEGKTVVELGQKLNNQGNPWRGMVMSTSSPIAFSPNYAVDKTLFGFGSNSTEVYKSTDGGNNWEIITIDKQYDIEADLTIKAKVFRAALRTYSLLKFLIAAAMALGAFWLIGYLRLEKLLPLNRLQVRIIGTIITCLVVLLGLSVVA